MTSNVLASFCVLLRPLRTVRVLASLCVFRHKDEDAAKDACKKHGRALWQYFPNGRAVLQRVWKLINADKEWTHNGRERD